MKIRSLIFLVAALAAYAASGWKVTLPNDVIAAGTKIKKGDYIVSVEDRKALFKKGKTAVAIAVDVEKSPDKFPATMLNLRGSKLLAIDVGGTDTMLLFADPN